jgi:hypothetical protein
VILCVGIICSEICVTASVKMIRFGYFHKDTKDKEKERARHRARLHPLYAVLRAKPATTLTPGPRHNATARGGRRLRGYSDDSPPVEVRTKAKEGGRQCRAEKRAGNGNRSVGVMLGHTSPSVSVRCGAVVVIAHAPSHRNACETHTYRRRVVHCPPSLQLR